jgi:hypothetical protein
MSKETHSNLHGIMKSMEHSTTAIPLTKLPHDVICNIFSFLDAKSLLRQRCLNRSLQQIACQSSLWEGQCEYLWKDKVHVLRQAKDLRTTDALAAYRMSLLDARSRHHVTREELCYDPARQKGTIWSIRFKEAAGKRA